MKKVLVVMMVVAMVFSAGIVLAGEKENDFSVSGELWLRSAYLGDTGGVFYKGLVIQPSVTISHNNTGLYVGVWGSIAPGKSPTEDNAGDNYGNEFDLYAGWAKKFGKLEADVMYAYYKIFPLNKWGYGDFHALSTKIGYALTDKITPYVKVNYYHIIGQTEQNGFAYRLGSVFDLMEHLKVDVSVGGHGALLGASEELLSSGRIALSFPWKVGALTIVPEVSYQHCFGYERVALGGRGLTESIFYAGVGITF
jgi:hypothetical protein